MSGLPAVAAGVVALQIALVVALGAARLAPVRPARESVRALRAVVLAALLVTAGVALAPRAPGEAVRGVAPQVYSAVGARVEAAGRVIGGVAGNAGEDGAGAGVVGTSSGTPGERAFLVVGLGVVAFGMGWLGLDLLRAARLLRGAVPVRELGRVRVAVSPGAAAPFALRTPGRAWIVLDAATWADPAARYAATLHEAGHHRGGDPGWALAFAALRVVAWPNPAAHLLTRHAVELEERAADEHAARRVGALPYARLLAAAAARAGGFSLAPAWSRSLLSRRISVLLAPPRVARRRTARLALAVSLVGMAALAPLPAAFAPVPAAVAAAPTGSRLDARPVSLPAAVEARLAAVIAAESGGAFPVEAPDVVRAVLLRYRTSPPAGAWMRSAVAARGEWRALVDGALAEAGLPAALAAVPLVESGYTNWGAEGVPGAGSAAPGTIPGRGLWMFIAPTARAYGLRVDGTIDERLDPTRETAAAVALLGDLYERYGDWRLALAGYNQGPGAVDAAIEAGGTDDPWALVEAGLLNGYLAQVMAGRVVLADPSLLD